MKDVRQNVFGKYLTSRLDIIDSKYGATQFPFIQIKRYDGIKITSEMPLKQYVGYIASYHDVNLYLREFPKSNILEEIEKSLALRFGYSDTEDNIRVGTQWNVFMVLGRNE
ncbi:uncharacterized protein LOC131927572 [Physella acuta]|uniref:uncharacterized protein LOC131927572 n=1 Tax=Physella acuta TaxID=109671 RepID=UPI0027DCD841|nr:uncharacterized protein LOC131927572 [Physella acuta]